MNIPNDIKIYIGMLSIALQDEYDPERVLALTQSLCNVISGCLENRMSGGITTSEAELTADKELVKKCYKVWLETRKNASYNLGKQDWKAILSNCSEINQKLWMIMLKYNLVAFKDNTFAKFGNITGGGANR